MNWTTSYILIRPKLEANAEIIYETNILKDARYWLQYVGQLGDAIFITNLHKLHKGEGEPQYMCHLIHKGKIDYNEGHWVKNFSNYLDNKDKDQLSHNLKSQKPGTKIIEINGESNKDLANTEVKALLNLNSKQLDILLTDSTKWINADSMQVLSIGDLYIISAKTASGGLLSITFMPNKNATKGVVSESKMQFIVSPRFDS